MSLFWADPEGTEPAGGDPESIPVLAGRRVVVAGFDPGATAELTALFDGMGAFCRAAPEASLPNALRACDLAILSIALAARPERLGTAVLAGIPRGSAAEHMRWLEQSGTEFMFFPSTREELLTRAAVALHRRESSGKPARNEVRVLLADDDPSITALLKVTMESGGMTCRCSRDGLEALNAIREWQPDVAVLDVNMPGIDGYQLLATLRRENPAGGLKIMLLTACDQESEVLKGFKLGAGDYVIKPFNPLEVLARVKRLVSEPV